MMGDARLASHRGSAHRFAPPPPTPSAMLFAVFYFTSIAVAVLALLVFLWRLVKAAERSATALEMIQQRLNENQP